MNGARMTETNAPATGAKRRRLFRRGPWENGASVLIAVGIFMLMQPFSMFLFGWSFAVILTGTLGFILVSHFPE